jgi:hypothetical protein
MLPQFLSGVFASLRMMVIVGAHIRMAGKAKRDAIIIIVETAF